VKIMSRKLLTVLLTCGCLLALAGEAWAGRFENEVRARWRGAWVVLKAEAYSACAGTYDTNKVAGSYVTAGGQHRFEPGELAKIDRVQVKRTRVQLMATLAERLLVPYHDGPFTLYTERTCQVTLGVLVGRGAIKQKDLAHVDLKLADVVERFPSRDAAIGSTLWNEREMEPYPHDYELTLARHAQWRAEQYNLAVDEKLRVALLQAHDAATDLTPDPVYLQGFAAGSEAMESWQVRDCNKLMACSLDTVLVSHDDHDHHHGHEHGEDAPPIPESWFRGWEDGQRLVFNISLLERLESCYVPVPEVPLELEELARVAETPPRASR
jgi:hypothetical protein